MRSARPLRIDPCSGFMSLCSGGTSLGTPGLVLPHVSADCCFCEVSFARIYPGPWSGAQYALQGSPSDPCSARYGGPPGRGLERARATSPQGARPRAHELVADALKAVLNRSRAASNAARDLAPGSWP